NSINQPKSNQPHTPTKQFNQSTQFQFLYPIPRTNSISQFHAPIPLPFLLANSMYQFHYSILSHKSTTLNTLQPSLHTTSILPKRHVA
ncbi:hypothetical protein LINPERHAP1_LOCUS18160, partial [Linum perenne]